MGIPQQKQELDLGLESVAREFQFSETDFRSLVALARERTGISLSDSKRNLIYSRLSRRLRALGMTSFRASPSSSANPTISIICATASPCRSHRPRRARPASGCGCGRPAAPPAKSLIRSRRCCGARSPISSSRTSAF
jgi:hypothetical protein